MTGDGGDPERLAAPVPRQESLAPAPGSVITEGFARPLFDESTGRLARAFALGLAMGIFLLRAARRR
jgi:hypothetical protein